MDPAPIHGLWADLYRPSLSPAETDFSVIGIPYDGAACARKGAALAPARIRFWSTHLTPFSEDRTRLEGMRVCDLGDVFTDSKWSHACVLRRGLEFGIHPEDVCLVGLRSWEDQEIDLIENGDLMFSRPRKWRSAA